MTDETLQAAEEAELPVEESESAPEVNENENLEADAPNEPAPPKEEPDEGDPDWYVQAINRQHKKYRDEERRRLELEQRLQQMESQLPKQDDRPEIPPAPDPFDDDYESKIAERDKAIRKAAEWEAQQQARQYADQMRQQQAMQERATQLRTTLQTYTGRATELGIKPEELQVAGNTVATMGVHDDVATYILADEKGPLITTYLARHPQEVEAMQSMTPVQAGVYLATKVRPKAESAHGITQAPPPPESLDGGGAPPQQRGPKGATFE